MKYFISKNPQKVTVINYLREQMRLCSRQKAKMKIYPSKNYVLISLYLKIYQFNFH